MTTDKPAKGRNYWHTYAWAAVVLAIMYPLLLGPAIWLRIEFDPRGEGWLMTLVDVVYGPACDSVDVIQQNTDIDIMSPFITYCNFWVYTIPHYRVHPQQSWF